MLLLAVLQSDAIVTLIGIVAGVALGAISIYERIEDKHYTTIKARLADEEKNSDMLKTKLRDYENKYGLLEKKS